MKERNEEKSGQSWPTHPGEIRHVVENAAVRNDQTPVGDHLAHLGQRHARQRLVAAVVARRARLGEGRRAVAALAGTLGSARGRRARELEKGRRGRQSRILSRRAARADDLCMKDNLCNCIHRSLS